MSDDIDRQIDDLASLASHMPDDSEITMTVGALRRLFVQVEECPNDCDHCHPPGCACTVHDE